MEMLLPQSLPELAGMLMTAASAKRTIRLSGASSKDRMAGPIQPADVHISTVRMNRVLEYEPRDLTISVEAGMRWADLTSLLEKNEQMIPLDPPFFDAATVGGVVAANSSGPRRRAYGTARDVVIGMKFATLEGKVVQSGGMVVKNVAGLDMGKLMVGSFGTLAAVGVVNFKLAPAPTTTRTFVLRLATLEEAIAARDAILQSVFQPLAIDLLNPSAASRVGFDRFCLIIEAGGNTAVLDRYAREVPAAEVLEGGAAGHLWRQIREFTPSYLKEFPQSAVLRISTTLDGIADVMRRLPGPVVARSGSGVIYAYFSEASTASMDGRKGVVEFSPHQRRSELELWPSAGSDFQVMKRIKDLFDPEHLLNAGRLYGRI